ncbi:MAG: sulfur carrier protein ThiS [Candidatus Omnitrophica bacterium]|nr:sulfur carrier protein ThiS [Candidatus Omnitrophota bacterium]
MKIKINGKNEDIEKRLNLDQLILEKGLCAERIVVEHNLRIVPKEEWKRVILHELDNIEIVSFVGGG